MRRKKYFDDEHAFQFIWDNADQDGIWNGDARTLAQEFGVSEDAAHSTLGELCTRRLIEKVYTRTYFIVKWRERDEPDPL
jgi:hypothetical protein